MRRSWDGQVASGVNMLQNSDSVLGRDGVEGSINAYADLFGGKTGKHSLNGLTKEAGELTSDESIKKRQEGYRTMVEGSPVSIHPSSALFNKNPEWLVYHELVLTSKEYMRNVMAIEPKWLVELAPRFFKRADAGQLSTAKRRQKIEPLYDRFNPEGSWRLSKRRG